MKRFAFTIILMALALACQPALDLMATDTRTPIVITSTSKPSPTLSPTETTIPPETPAATTPEGISRVNIFLVAVGDEGRTGREIGCGDSLVPVEVQIEPTLGVLRAALEELLKLEGESHYGQSGLYNALYLSDLSIGNVAVVDGEAVIRLEGDLVFGGECDIPRIEQQLRALALQFQTVDSVRIFVNGERLEDLLDLRG